jgi:hypothetical protein
VEPDELGKIRQDSNIYVYTKRDWRYMYRVSEVATLSDKSDRYVMPQTSTNRLYLVVRGSTGPTIIAATLTNVQSGDQQ